MKTIGVLGGLGPQATMDFEARVHAVSQRLIPQRANAGYPPMVVYYHRHAPVLLNDDGTPVLPIQPDTRLFDAARRVGSLADFLVITANGPHMLRDAIEQAAGRPVLSMIDVTLDEVRRRGCRTLGVLGLGEPMVYLAPLGQLGVACETVDGDLRDRLDRAIVGLMEGRTGAESSVVAREAVDTLRGRGVDAVILGCTEIPLLLGGAADALDLINPAQLLAEATVRHAIG
jgi:aspartate racemase